MVPVSVIIPLYNKEQYIEQTIYSVLKQTEQPQEIIVVDDVSSDASVEIVKRMQSEYSSIRLVCLEENRGVSHARNVGAQVAKTNLITYLDADDSYWNINKLENEYRLFDEYYKSGIEICAYSKVIHINQKGEAISTPPKNSKYLQGDILTPLLEWIDFSTVPRDYLVTKDALLSVGGYDENRSQFEDLDVVYKLAHKYPFYCTMEIGTAYRITGQGLSAADNGNIGRNRREVIEKNMQLLDSKSRIAVQRKRKIRTKIYKIRCGVANTIKKFI